MLPKMLGSAHVAQACLKEKCVANSQNRDDVLRTMRIEIKNRLKLVCKILSSNVRMRVESCKQMQMLVVV